MHEVMEPYDYVKREEYDEDRVERLMPDFMLEGNAYILRYIQSKNPEPFYATDYMVCIRGIIQKRRLTTVQFSPIPLDGTPIMNAVGQVQTNNEGIVVQKNLIATVERGYFAGDGNLYPPEEIPAATEQEQWSWPRYSLGSRS